MLLTAFKIEEGAMNPRMHTAIETGEGKEMNFPFEVPGGRES